MGFARVALLGKSMECRHLPVISKIRWDAAEEELTKAGVSTDVVKSLALLRLSHRSTSVDSDNDDDEETAKTIQQARQGELDAAAETGKSGGRRCIGCLGDGAAPPLVKNIAKKLRKP